VDDPVPGGCAVFLFVVRLGDAASGAGLVLGLLWSAGTFGGGLGGRCHSASAASCSALVLPQLIRQLHQHHLMQPQVVVSLMSVCHE
jgi:hypothetical protein